MNFNSLLLIFFTAFFPHQSSQGGGGAINIPPFPPNPKELQGSWKGILLNSNSEFCSIFYSTSFWIAEYQACTEQFLSLTQAEVQQKVYGEDEGIIGNTVEIICKGLGQGILYTLDANGFNCGNFERKGDKVFVSFGQPAMSVEAAKCPPTATADPLNNPEEFGIVDYTAVDEIAKSTMPSQYTCQ